MYVFKISSFDLSFNAMENIVNDVNFMIMIYSKTLFVAMLIKESS